MTIEQELELIRQGNGASKLDPQEVVAFASDPSTALHRKFDWDDDTAAHKYRVWQARQLIVKVTIKPHEKAGDIQAYVSLTTDRGEGGYRAIGDVLDDDEMRAQLVLDAAEEMATFQAKYGRYTELAGVWEEIRRVKKVAKRRVRKPKKGPNPPQARV